MTARQVYEGVLTEMNKVLAPSLLLEDFNYLFNKAIYQYINKRYNIYDVNQQTTDDVRVLKSTAILPVALSYDKYALPADNITDTQTAYEAVEAANALFGATYEAALPQDYLHILNCICIFKVAKRFKCYNKGSHVQFAARRLTADMWSQLVNNLYMCPTYKRPYYYIHNVNKSTNIPTNAYVEPDATDWQVGLGTTDVTDGLYNVTSADDNEGSNFPRTITIGSGEDATTINMVERDVAVRYGNTSTVRLEVRYGKDSSLFQLVGVYVDYLKTPQHIRLTQELLDLTEDTSQIMEFPDYVCQEIIDELTKLVMENASDPRLQTFIPVTQSIANPAQELAQSQSKK